jgi:hypothetical protein
MNDKVWYVNPEMQNYEQEVQDFMDIYGWDKSYNSTNSEQTIEYFMNRGVDRAQAEAYIVRKDRIANNFKKQVKNSFLHVQGLLITYGRK